MTACISDFNASERGPKIAWMLLPTSRTPAAPRRFNSSLLTWLLSLTSTRRRVIHASKCLMFCEPDDLSASGQLNRGTGPMTRTYGQFLRSAAYRVQPIVSESRQLATLTYLNLIFLFHRCIGYHEVILTQRWPARCEQEWRWMQRRRESNEKKCWETSFSDFCVWLKQENIEALRLARNYLP